MGNRSLLNYDTARELGLIKITLSAVSTEPASCMTARKIYEEYPDLFTGGGKLKNCQVKLHIDKSVQPIAQPHRRVPFHLRKKLEAELQALEDADIIEKVDGPTPWVSPIVVAPKPKNPEKIRVCVDMRIPIRPSNVNATLHQPWMISSAS